MLRSLWVVVVLVVATVVLGTTAAVLCLVLPGSNATMRLGKVWSRVILATAGIRPSFEHLEFATLHQPCIYMANHQSLVDILVTVLVLPPKTRYVAKKSLFLIPFFGWSLYASGFIPIDRRNRKRAIESLHKAADAVRSGRPVLLFPEGTRTSDGVLGPFKKGAFRLALRAAVPVVPIAISGSWKTLPRGSLRFRPGRVRVRFARPIDAGRFQPEDLAGLMAEVRRAIAEGLADAEAGRDRRPTVSLPR